MKRFFILSAALAVLMIGSAFGANVTNIELSHLHNGLVAKIKVTDGQVRFQHQVEEPKNGKPHRVIVDILAATHALGKQSFTNLPSSPITQIRTSQFSVTPEKIVRVVFDMANAPLYQVSDDEAGYVKVIFTDRTVDPFITWNSSKNAEAKPTPAPSKPATVAKATSHDKAVQKADDFNKSAQSDKLASLSPAETVPVPAAPQPKQTTRKPAYTAKKEAQAKPKVEAKKPAQSASTTPTVTAVPKKAEPASGDTKKAEPKKSGPPVVVAPKQAETVQPKADTQLTPQPPKKMPAKDPVPGASNPEATVAKKAAQEKSKSADAPKKKAKPKVAKKVEPARAKSAPAPTKKTEVAQAQPKQTKKTSRFRRSPTRPSKLKGTMVAEFPKRLVIKYKARNRRDPFATLIDETRTYDSPVEQRIPNVEGLRLVGIIEAGDGANQALFEDNTGYSYILKSGDKVKKGYVLRVEADRVYFQIFEYGWSRTVALEIEE